MPSESPHPASRPTSSRLALLATLLAIAAVACGSVIQSTMADPWLNVLFVLVLLLPVLRGELGRQHSWLQQYDQSYRRALLVAGLGWALVTACLYLVRIRPFIGDVDLFYYLCNARDMNNHSLTSNDCYSYFPGVYSFWRTVMLTVGQRLEAIQWTYLLVILTNVLLVAAIVWRHSRCLASSLFAGCWLLVLTSRFQATTGETENGRSMKVSSTLLPRKSNLAIAQAAATPNTRFNGTAMTAAVSVNQMADTASGSVMAAR